MDDLVLQFKKWIYSNLATAEPFLNNLPPCPFAREAVVQQKLKMVKCTEDFLACVEGEVIDFIRTSKDAVIFVDPKKVSGEEFESGVLALREKYFMQNVWVLYDHPDFPEIQGDLQFNFPGSALVILQSLTRLVEASTELEKRGYYRNWSPDYYEQVVARRKTYYDQLMRQRYLEMHESRVD